VIYSSQGKYGIFSARNRKGETAYKGTVFPEYHPAQRKHRADRHKRGSEAEPAEKMGKATIERKIYAAE